MERVKMKLKLPLENRLLKIILMKNLKNFIKEFLTIKKYLNNLIDIKIYFILKIKI